MAEFSEHPPSDEQFQSEKISGETILPVGKTFSLKVPEPTGIEIKFTTNLPGVSLVDTITHFIDESTLQQKTVEETKRRALRIFQYCEERLKFEMTDEDRLQKAEVEKATFIDTSAKRLIAMQMVKMPYNLEHVQKVLTEQK